MGTNDQEQSLQLIPLLSGNQHFDKIKRVLILQKAEPFTVTLSELLAQPDKSVTPAQGPVPDSNKQHVDKYKDMSWVWQIAATPDRLARAKGNESFGKGIPGGKRSISFPRFLEGGAYIWLEGFQKAATGSPANGFFVCAKGKPDIIGVEWTDLAGNNIDGKSVLPGDTVMLHVYTEGLYGSQVVVQLRDMDTMGLIDAPDDLPAYERSGGVAKNKDEAQPTPAKDFKVLTRPVSYEVFKQAKLSTAAQNKRLLESLGQLEGNTGNYAQKSEIEVYVDEYWRFDGGKSLKIYPTVNVRSLNNPKVFADKFIQVAYEPNKLPVRSALSNEGNKPILVGDVETNLQAFRHCYYTAVKISLPQKNAAGKEVETPLYLFKEKSEDSLLQQIRDFEVVAGETGNLAKITVALEALHNDESECVNEVKHKGKTMKMVAYPETKTSGYPQQAITGDEEKGGVKFTGKAKVDIGIGNAETKRSAPKEIALKIYTPESSDDKITFDARFIYNKDTLVLVPGKVELPYAFRYFWMNNSVAGKPYIVAADTCRYTNRIKVVPFPDIEWKLAVEYNKFEEGTGEDASAKASRTLMSTSIQSQERHKPKHAFASVGGRKLGASLGAKWDGQDEISFSAEFVKNLEERLKTITTIIEYMEAFFSPKDENGQRSGDNQQTIDEFRRGQGNAITERERDEREMRKQRQYVDDARRAYREAPEGSREQKEARKKMESLQRRDERYFPKLKRTAIGIDIIWPSFEGSFSWKLVQTPPEQPDKYRNRVGLMLTGSIEFAPLLGASIYFDFLALVQRAHPIAYAVVAIADLSLSLLGDGSKIVCELRATGTIGGKLEGFLNTLTGENTLNKKDRDANGKPIVSVTGEIKVSLKIQIKIASKKNLIFVSVEGSLNLGVEATAAWKSRADIESDNKGFYADVYGNFDGLIIKGKAQVSVKVKGRKGGDGVGGEAGGEMQPWEAIKKKKEEKLGQVRLGSL